MKIGPTHSVCVVILSSIGLWKGSYLISPFAFKEQVHTKAQRCRYGPQVLGLSAEMGGVHQLQPFPLAELCGQRVDGKWSRLYFLFILEAPGELLSSSVLFTERS